MILFLVIIFLILFIIFKNKNEDIENYILDKNLMDEPELTPSMKIVSKTSNKKQAHTTRDLYVRNEPRPKGPKYLSEKHPESITAHLDFEGCIVVTRCRLTHKSKTNKADNIHIGLSADDKVYIVVNSFEVNRLTSNRQKWLFLYNLEGGRKNYKLSEKVDSVKINEAIYNVAVTNGNNIKNKNPIVDINADIDVFISAISKENLDKILPLNELIKD
jgi:hypothetical protein